MKVNGTWLLLAILVTFGLCYVYVKKECKEGMSGYGVTSGLAFNNRHPYCDGPVGNWSGGCIIPHRVIV